MRLPWTLAALCATLATSIHFSTVQDDWTPNLLPRDISIFDDRPPGCPPCPSCFNCNLESSPCLQFGNCTSSTGTCKCPAGFGDVDCSKAQCGSLADGEDRPFNDKKKDPNDANRYLGCDCPDGWEGMNCNVCTENRACAPLKPEGAEDEDMFCYKQGMVQKENHQACDVTNKQIKESLKPRKPQVTFSCNAEQASCNFQCMSTQIREVRMATNR